MNDAHEQMSQKFARGSRVRVSATGGWKQSFCGAVRADPESTVTLKGAAFIHWVEFDEPQECVDGSDQYITAQILGCYLEAAS
jgi:hypothetical protein